MAENAAHTSSSTPVVEAPLAREPKDVGYDSASNGSQGLGPESATTDETTLEKGNLDAENPKSFKNMAWWQAGMIMIAETISLGILSLPSVLAAIGILPGVILILGLGCLATYTGFVIGQFKLRYPNVMNMAEAGDVMFGRVGKEIFGFAQITFMTFVMASHVLTFSIMMNVLTENARWRCTLVFALVGAVICFVCTLPRQLLSVAHMAIVSFISIVIAVTITMVGVGTGRPGDGHVDLMVQTSLYQGFLGVTNVIFAYAGHVAFFAFISELKEPKEYPKALYLLQSVDTTMYLIVALVTYIYAGTNVASPALGSTGPLLSKVAYGIAIPTIVVSGVINGHVAVKYLHQRICGAGKILDDGFVARGMWVLLGLLLWTLAWIIAEAIPVFNDLLGLISALFASWFTYGVSGIFWLYMNRGHYKDSKTKMFLTCLNVFVFILGGLICGLGLYSSVISIASGDGQNTGVFSCADNSKLSAA